MGLVAQGRRVVCGGPAAFRADAREKHRPAGTARLEAAYGHRVAQKEYFKANCNCRMVLAELITPNVDGLRASELGAFQLG